MICASKLLAFYLLTGTNTNLVENNNSWRHNPKYTTVWDGSDESGKILDTGIYFVILNAADSVIGKSNIISPVKSSLATRIT